MNDSGGEGSGPIDIPVTSSGAEGVDRIVTAIDRLYESLQALGTVSGLTKLEQQMQVMQASMTTGFANLAAEAQKGGNKIVAEVEKTEEQIALVNEKARDRQLNADRVFLQARENLRAQTARATPTDARTLLGMPSEADARFAGRQIAAQMREGVETEMARARAASKIDARTLLGLPSETESRLAGAQIAAQMREAVAQENLRARAASPIDARTLLGLPPEAEMRTVGSQIAAQMRESVAAEAAVAKAATEARIASQRLSGAAAREAAVGEGILADALKQTEGAFRGAAHQAGIYGLHHGQLIALLAGGAVAAALHHIAVTGAEAEFALTNLNALADETNRSPLDFDKFIGITAGTLSNLDQAAEGMAALAEAGFNQQKALVALPDVLRLATLGNMTVAQSAEMAVESMHAFGLSVTDLGKVGDILVTVGAQSNVSVHKLAEDMKSAATTGALFNLSMEEITATVGALAERGLTIQPLSSALTKLYEPSAKSAAVMKEWNLSVKDGEGNLKNYTQFMGELADKVNQFKVPADALKALGMSSRDIKALEVMTQHLDDYTHLLHAAQDAEGKMFSAMTMKEDTVEGAWLRMKSTFDGSVLKAFENASPVIQKVENDLMRMAGSDTTVTMLEHLATGIARLTQLLVENAGTVGIAVAAYTGMRILSSAATWAAELAAAKVKQEVATRAAAAATALETERLALLTVEERAAAVAAASTATAMEAVATRSAAAATGIGLVTAAMGWIAVAVTAATVAYELYRNTLGESDKEHIKAVNTIETTIDAYDREVNRLKELEKQLRLTGKAGVESALEVAMADATWERAKAQTRLAQVDREKPQATSMGAIVPGRGAVDFGMEAWKQQRREALDAIADADKLLADLVGRTGTLEKQRAATKEAQSIADLQKKINEFPPEVKASAKTEQAQAAAEVANQELKALREQAVTAANLNYLSSVALDLEKQIARTKLDVTVGGNDKKAAADAYRAAVTDLNDDLQQVQKNAQTAARDIAAAYKAGTISAVQAAKDEHDVQVAGLEAAIDIAKKKAGLAAGKENGLADAAKANKEGDAARAAIREADAKLERDYSAIVKHETDERTKYEIDAARAAGNTALAYKLANADKMAATDKSLADAREMLNRAVADKDAKNLAVALKLVSVLEDAKDRAEGAIKAATNVDAVTKAEKAFQALGATLKAGLADLAVGPEAGPVAMFNAAADAAQLYADKLPQLIAKQKELAAAAAVSGRPEDQKKADDALAQITAAAERARNVWVDVSKSIGQSLSDAFGEGGKALSSLLTASLAYGARQQQIADQLAKNKDDPKAQQKAALDTSLAQVHAYGDMAGAAAGFFDKQSKGYQALTRVSQVFHAAELAMTLASLVPKAIAAVLTQGEGDPYTAFGRMAAMAALVAGLGVAVSGGGSTPAAERQKTQGTGSVLGSPHAQSTSIARAIELSAANSNVLIDYTFDMVTSLRNIENNIVSFASQLVRSTNITGDLGGVDKGFGANFGKYLVSPVLSLFGGWIGKQMSSIGNSIFGGNTYAQDTGITLASNSTLGSIAAYGAQTYQYTDMKKDGGWFSGDKHWTDYSSLGADANSQFTLVLTSIADSVREAGKLLGVSGYGFTDKLNSFVVDIGKVSLKGLTGEEIQKQLEAVFSKVGDDLASYMVPEVTQFAKVGEGALETLVRVATDYAQVNGILQGIGMTFRTTGVASIAAREHLIDLAGGIDKLASQASSFAQNYLTKGEQLAPVAKYVNEQLAALHLGWVTTRDDFKMVVQTLDLTDPASQQLYVSLMALQDAFAKTHAATVDLTKTEQEISDERTNLQDQLNQLVLTEAQLTAIERAKLDASNRNLFDQVQAAKAVSSAKDALKSAYDTERQNITATITRLSSLSDSWKKFRDSLVLGNSSVLTPQQKYLEARSQYESTLAAARAGDQNAQANYQSAAQAFLDASRTANASGSAYTSDFNQVLQATSEAATWAAQQVDVSKASLEALDNTVGQLITINTSVLSVQQAIVELGQAMDHLAALQAAGTGGTSAPPGTVPPSTTPFDPGSTNLDGTATAPPVMEYVGYYAPPAQIDALIAEVQGLRADLAAQSADNINSNVQATLDAAAQVADSVESASTASQWGDRIMAYDK